MYEIEPGHLINLAHVASARWIDAAGQYTTDSAHFAQLELILASSGFATRHGSGPMMIMLDAPAAQDVYALLIRRSS